MRDLTIVEHVNKYHAVMDKHSKNTAIELMTRSKLALERDLKNVSHLPSDSTMDEFRSVVENEIAEINKALVLCKE